MVQLAMSLKSVMAKQEIVFKGKINIGWVFVDVVFRKMKSVVQYSLDQNMAALNLYRPI